MENLFHGPPILIVHDPHYVVIDAKLHSPKVDIVLGEWLQPVMTS